MTKALTLILEANEQVKLWSRQPITDETSLRRRLALERRDTYVLFVLDLMAVKEGR